MKPKIIGIIPARYASTRLPGKALKLIRVLEHGYKLRVVETRVTDHEFAGFSVDTAEDLIRAEQMLRARGLT